jgi:hypothetical protein
MAAMKASRTIKEMPDVKCLLGCAPIALAAAEEFARGYNQHACVSTHS